MRFTRDGVNGNQWRGKNHYRWQRAPLASSHGYVKIRVGRGHPLADPNGYAYQHLVVWVSAGKNKPGRGEVLRFRDNDRTNCRIENLYVVARSEHNRLNNSVRLRDAGGRLMSKRVSRAVQLGATVRTVRMKR